MGEEENKSKRLKFFADLERKGISFLNSTKSGRLKELIESDFFKFFILLGIYFLIVIVSLFKTKKENNYISEFIYIFDPEKEFPYFGKYLKIDPKLKFELTKKEYLKLVEGTLFFKVIYSITILIQIILVLTIITIFLFTLVEQLERLFDYLENSINNTSLLINDANQVIDSTSQLINKTAENTSKVITSTAKDTAEILNSTAETLKQRSYMNDLKNIFHGIKEFFHSVREFKESAISLGKEIIQLWKDA